MVSDGDTVVCDNLTVENTPIRANDSDNTRITVQPGAVIDIADGLDRAISFVARPGSADNNVIDIFGRVINRSTTRDEPAIEFLGSGNLVTVRNGGEVVSTNNTGINIIRDRSLGLATENNAVIVEPGGVITTPGNDGIAVESNNSTLNMAGTINGRDGVFLQGFGNTLLLPGSVNFTAVGGQIVNRDADPVTNEELVAEARSVARISGTVSEVGTNTTPVGFGGLGQVDIFVSGQIETRSANGQAIQLQPFGVGASTSVTVQNGARVRSGSTDTTSIGISVFTPTRVEGATDIAANITVEPGGTVHGSAHAIAVDEGVFETLGAAFGVPPTVFETLFSPSRAIVTVAGSLTQSDPSQPIIVFGRGDDELEIQPTADFTGFVEAGSGNDTLRLGGTGSGTFNLDDIDDGTHTRRFREFETFEIASGEWALSGSTDLTLTANSGLVSGNITVGGLVLNRTATAAPGASIGTIKVNGNVAFNAGTTYQVEVNASGQSDLIAASGTVAISTTGTALDVIAEAGAYPATSPTYTILTAAGGVTGQFATVQDNLPDLNFEASYTANSVQLTYVADPAFASQKEVHPSALGGAMAAGHLFSETLRRRGSLVAVNAFDGALSNLSLGFTSASHAPGEAELPSHVTAADVPSVPISAPELSAEWGMWGAVLGGALDVDGTATAAGWDATTGGLAFGIERRFDGLGLFEAFDVPFIIGLAGGYAVSDVDSGPSDADVDSYQVGIYTASKIGALSLSGAYAYAWQDYDFTRRITAGTTATATGQTDGYTFTSAFEAFYDVVEGAGLAGPDRPAFNGLAFGPLVTVDSIYAGFDGFTETGAGVLNLTVSDTDASQTVTGFGIAGRFERAFGAALVTIDSRIAWEHVFGDRSITTNSAIAAVAGANFATASTPIDRDRIAVGLGAALEFSDTVAAHLRYDGAFSGSTTDHRGSAGVTIRF